MLITLGLRGPGAKPLLPRRETLGDQRSTPGMRGGLAGKVVTLEFEQELQ